MLHERYNRHKLASELPNLSGISSKYGIRDWRLARSFGSDASEQWRHQNRRVSELHRAICIAPWREPPVLHGPAPCRHSDADEINLNPKEIYDEQA